MGKINDLCDSKRVATQALYDECRYLGTELERFASQFGDVYQIEMIHNKEAGFSLMSLYANDIVLDVTLSDTGETGMAIHLEDEDA